MLTVVLAVILQNFVVPTVASKKVSAKDRRGKKKRMICIELKTEITEKLNQGVVAMTKQHEPNISTICTAKEQNESINSRMLVKGIKIISRQRTFIPENMEKLLNEGLVDGETGIPWRYHDGGYNLRGGTS